LARKILLADDSVTAQNMGRKILADAGYDIVTVNNGSAALKRVSETKPDLIVLDVYMPGYSGLEVCQRLKDAEETAHIPVLLTVGKLEPFKPEEARRVRADGHIVKPFEASELLTAITRLEDAMVPQQASGSRFEGGRKSDVKPGSDTGWKTRLGFPSKKKKEEKEEAEDFTAGTFHDFRKGKNKAGASAPTANAAPFKEPDLVPDIPRDITPEELDALSAVAAKLDRPMAAAQKAAAPNPTPVATTTAPTVAAGTEVVAAADAKQAEKTEVELQPVPVQAAAVAAPGFAVEAAVPVEPKELATDAAPVVADPAVVATRPHGSEQAAGQPAQVEHVADHASETPHLETQVLETQVSESRPAVAPAMDAVAVDTALLAQGAAPVDRTDEPMFATVPSPVETAPQETAEAKSVEAFAVTNSQTTETTETIETTGASAVAQTTAAEEPGPSDEELAQALRLLTPSTGQPDISAPSTVPSHGTLVAAGQLLAEEVARNAAAGSRWVAEPAALSPEEAAISLETEMFRTFAALQSATLGNEMEPPRITGVSAIAAAVENRLAAVELAATEKVLSECGPDLSAHSSDYVSDQRASDGRASETMSVETSAGTAETPAVISAGASAVVGNGKLGDSSSVINIAAEAAQIALGKLAAEAIDSPEKAAEEAPAEDFAATFADAISQSVVEQDAVEKSLVSQSEVSRDDVDSVAKQDDVPAGETTAAAVAEQSWDSSSQGEGQEAMGKDGKSKKTNWHQIHSAPASAAAKGDVVEAAKEAESVVEEAPKAMAAAAASVPASAPDASTIASIVDSVMADLRPKIVEEIAKKLAGK
jgi:CheY-like chemotaxis protein